jgi:hypothetical protein
LIVYCVEGAGAVTRNHYPGTFLARAIHRVDYLFNFIAFSKVWPNGLATDNASDEIVHLEELEVMNADVRAGNWPEDAEVPMSWAKLNRPEPVNLVRIRIQRNFELVHVLLVDEPAGHDPRLWA